MKAPRRENILITEYLGYKYRAVVQEDFSDCGGCYEDTPIYSKVPIALTGEELILK